MSAAQTLHLALPQFQAFSILLVRIAGIVSVFPILNTRTIPMPVKTGLVATLGLVLAPIIHLPSLPTDPALVIAGIGSEFLIGLTIGLAVRLLFSGFQVAGDMIGTQMGFSAIQMFDPMSHQNTPIIAQFQLTLGSLVFLSLNAHLLVVHAIGMSYEYVPPFGASLSDGIASGYHSPGAEHAGGRPQARGSRFRDSPDRQYRPGNPWSGGTSDERVRHEFSDHHRGGLPRDEPSDALSPCCCLKKNSKPWWKPFSDS
jgi:hypothetical protein